ncbi:MAG: sigma-70 family RNA polymerase sigma factor [Pelagimonas sp.]|uniref:sigma-70 family RNA polymerase sigma factor n=1 Tax=Pelagimonas sp. TaxID=2073170 RepID=UPI003D6AA800
MTSKADLEDYIARIALRDRVAFSKLYDATSAKLFGVCLRVLNNRSEAEDVLQEAYSRIWQKSDRYAVTGHSPMTWLITIARNLSIDRLRTRKTTSVGVEEASQIADTRPGPETAAIARSESRAIHACLDELKPNRAEAVRRAYLDGETYKDLAARFDVPLNTMRTWLRRSLLDLKACLSQ